MSTSDYNFNLKVIIILIAIEVVILVCMSFVKMYIDRKHSTLDRMRDEVQILEKMFLDKIEYSSYALNQMGDLIRASYPSESRIDGILSHYSLNINDQNFFGWRGFYWVDKKGIIRSASRDCSIPIGGNLSHHSSVRLSKINPGKVFSSRNPRANNDSIPFLDLALGLTNSAGEYIGSILLEVDTSSILEDIEMYRRNNLTEFLILDNRMNIIKSYPMNSNRISKDGKTITNEALQQKIKNINFFSEKQREVWDLQILNGSNFLARKIKNKPYLFIVSLDPVYIKSNYTRKVAIKFIEISVLAVSFLAIIAIVYKRETLLRSKAEKASSMATKAMVAKSDFLSYTAHEIRSPLGFILTGSEMMSKKLFGPIPEQYEEYVMGIYHNAKLILDFINDILDEKNIATGNFRLVEEVCDLKQLVKIAAKTNQTRFHSKKINLDIKVADDVPFILGDKRKLLQMMNNIISNSYKYSLDNTTIFIQAKRVGKRVKISVRDQGIGMTNEEIQIALTKYGTVHNNRSDNFIESYGLGLPIVVILTKAHDAVLHITSEIGVGTEASIMLPEKRVIERGV